MARLASVDGQYLPHRWIDRDPVGNSAPGPISRTLLEHYLARVAAAA
jgi:hypothetical protein